MPFWRKLIVVLGLLWLCATDVYAVTDAGTTIVNQATLTYMDKATGQLIELKSNTSTIQVAPLRQFELLSSNTIVALAGQSVTLSHTLQNIGNVDDQYLITVANQLADSGDLINLMIYIDANSNGVVDSDETTVDQELSLAAGETVALVVTGILPAELVGNDEVELVLLATSVDDTLSAQSNTDIITVKPVAKLTLDLVGSQSCDVLSQAGDKVEFTLTAINVSETLPEERQLIVDGQARNGVLLEIDITPGLALIAEQTLDIVAYNGIAMVQTEGGGDEWMRYEHWTGVTSIDRFGLFVPQDSFSIDELVAVVLPMLVERSEVGAKVFVTGGSDLDADGLRDFEFEPPCINVVALGSAVATEIRFLEPTIDLQKQGRAPRFDVDADFVDAPMYQLHMPNGDPASSTNLTTASADEYELSINGVYVELSSTVSDIQVITDENNVRYVVVKVESLTTGDHVQLLLRETSTASDLFRSIKPILLSNELSGDGDFCPGGSGALLMAPDYEDSDSVCVLASTIDDTLTATFTEQVSGGSVSDTALVNPVSRVFDSTSLQGIADAMVAIVIDGVVQTHPISGLPLEYTTDAEGRYALPRLLPAENYSIQVQAPSAYVFPSSVTPTQFTSFTVVDASYGEAGFAQSGNGVFSVLANEIAPVIDIPLDPNNRNTLLLVDKAAGATSVDIGETLAYTITVKNRGRGLLNNVSVIDYPAYGFRYISGTATFNDQPLADPKRLSVPASSVDDATSDNQVVTGLQFLLAQVPAESEGELRYHMQATAGAGDGNGINRATANATTVSGLVLSTPTSTAIVKIERSGVLSDKAILFGKVYVDSSCDSIQNRGEWPIGGVRLYLHDGTFVITDEDGQFSIYGLDPGLHVLKIDKQTMPSGLILKPTDTRQAADPESRFVELSAGDFHRADFATYCPKQNTDVVFAELKDRNLNFRNGALLNEASRYDPEAKAPSQDARKRADTDGDLSQAILGFPRVNGENKDVVSRKKTLLPVIENGQAIDQSSENNINDDSGSVYSARSLETPKMGNPKELVKEITEEQATKGTWLWPQDDLSWDGRFMAVIKSGLDPQLYVNEQPVARTQIGEQIINRRERAQLVAWYGIKLVPGLNQVEVRAKDSFGNERVLAEGAFRRPSAGVRILLRTKQDTLEADGGASTLPIDIVITDAQNNPANGVYFVTLRSTGGSFKEQDLQVREPGMQVRVENGRGKVHLLSTEVTGNVRVQARTGALDASLNVVQIAAARPLIGAGLIDIGGQWNRVDAGLDSRADLDNGFQTDARIALFLKGRIKNDYHLSLSYDSDKHNDVDVLRDLNPNAYYATYGDSSLRGVEAQSRSKLYLKLEKDRNSVMWGDYLTDSNAQFDDLGRVQRTLTGINGVLDNGRTRLQVFSAQESSTNRSEEIAGNGTAMLYQIARAPIEVNSEIVERIVRDRNNPGLVLQSETLQRYSDYSIDFVTGALRFADVVPTVDSDLNPIYIRVSYDLQGRTDEYLVSGVRLIHEFHPRLLGGVSITDDQNPISGYTLNSVAGEAQLSVNTKLSATVAVQSHRADQTNGDAHRVNIEHNWHGRRDYRTAMTWARASRFFDNPAGGISPGREEVRFEHRQPIGNTIKAVADASHSRSLGDNNTNVNAGLAFEKTFSNWSLRAGGRHIQSQNQATAFTFNTFLVGAQKRFTFGNGRRGSIGIDYEQDATTTERFKLGLSSRLQLHEHVSVYARYELDQGLAFQSYSINDNRNRLFTAGVESDILPSTKLYSEYRMRGNFGGQTMETASGVRGRYEISPDLVVSPAIEIIDVIDGTNAEDSFAVSLGVSDKRNPNRKLVAQAEIRETESSRYYGFRGSVAQRLNVDWTGLLREEFTRQTPDIGQLTSRHRLTLGLARRPKLSNEQHGLYMANWKADFGPQDGQDSDTFLLSTHQNRQIAHNATLSGRAGSRWTNTEFDSGAIRTQAFMTDLRATFDIRRRWELDMRGGWLGTGSLADGKYAFGVGLAWIADRNVRLGIRYNVIGFREEDLDEQGYNTQGLRIGLQVKFDEDWFRWLE